MRKVHTGALCISRLCGSDTVKALLIKFLGFSLFLLQITTLKEEFLGCYIFREAKISHFASGAYFAIVAQRSLYKSEITLHFLDVASDFNYNVFAYRNRVAVSHGKVCGLSGSLKLSVDYPTSNLVHQCRLDASMKGVQPALEVSVRFPEANDIIAIFLKFHFQAKWVARTAGKTVIALIFHACVWVLYFFHNCGYCYIIFKDKHNISNVIVHFHE